MRLTMRSRAARAIAAVALSAATLRAAPVSRCAADALQGVAIHTRAALRCHAVAAVSAGAVDPTCLARAARRGAGRLRRAAVEDGCGAIGAWDALVTSFAADVTAASPATGDAAQRRCSGAVRAATGRFAGALLTCAARIAATGGDMDPACAGPAEDRFAVAVHAAVDRGGCAADLVQLAGFADGLVDAVRSAVQSGATTTSTTTVGSTTTSTTSPPAIGFAADVVPIFAAHCVTIGCHVGQYAASGLDLSTAASAYAQLVGVASVEKPSLQRVRSRHPGTSYLLDKLQNAGGILGAPMPPTGALSASDIQTINDWIAAGAAND